MAGLWGAHPSLPGSWVDESDQQINNLEKHHNPASSLFSPLPPVALRYGLPGGGGEIANDTFWIPALRTRSST
jgi:hypothetical protein